MRKASLALTAINQERDSAPHILPMKPAVGLLTLNFQGAAPVIRVVAVHVRWIRKNRKVCQGAAR